MNSALVVEGGAMRGMHTSAVFDVFLENNIEFPHVTAVSAGALNGMSYISKQPYRAYKINTGYMRDRRYYNIFNMFKGESVFGFDFIFGELAKNHIPFDFDEYRNSKQKFYITTTDVETGDTVFFEKSDCEDISKPAIASSSLPILFPPVDIEGRYYLDGGVSNAVPYEKAFDDGYKKVVLLLTRNKGYRKPPISDITKRFCTEKFKTHPNLLEKILTANQRYNDKMDEIDRLEEEGRIFVIRPSKPITISRLEKNIRKLDAVYQEGIKDGNAIVESMLDYINN